MKKTIVDSVIFTAALLTGALWESAAHADGEGPTCLLQNGNLNGDQILDLSDAIYTLVYLFAGGPAPAPQFVEEEDCVITLRNELALTRGDLEQCRTALSARDMELTTIKAALAECQATLDMRLSDLLKLQNTLAAKESELAACHSSLEACLNSSQFPILPATGELNCYDSTGNLIDCGTTCSGQDASYQAGCPTVGRFVDNLDGTVTDTCTGLMWQKDTADVNGDGQITVDGDSIPWCDALAYCEGLSFAGHDDWRLPNIRELVSIVDYGRSNPAIDPVFGALSAGYRSSTTFDSIPRAVWGVSFDRGGIYSSGGYLRAVRSEPFLEMHPLAECRKNQLPDTGQEKCAYFVQEIGWVEVPCDKATCKGQDGAYSTGCSMVGRFVDNFDGTVTDTCTGLMWQQDTADVNGDGHIDRAGDAIPWCDALASCESLSFAGHDDWRLPNIRELLSIVDYGYSNPAINPVFGAISEYYWSSTPYKTSFNAGWIVNWDRGYAYNPEPARANYFRAVRGGLR